MSARDQILGKIRQLQEEKHSRDDILSSRGDVFSKMEGSLADHFVINLEAVQGEVILCENRHTIASELRELTKKASWQNIHCHDTGIQSLLESCSVEYYAEESEFLNMEVGITNCESLIALTGGVMVHSGLESGRRMNVYPPIHIIIANVSQVVATPEDALKGIRAKYGNTNFPSMISVITGPSRTADIEKTLIMGAHGPKRLIVLLNQSS